MLNYKKIGKLYGFHFPKDLDKFKALVDKVNSKSQLIKLTGISKNYVDKLLEEFNLEIVPKCLYCNKPLPKSPNGTIKKYCDNSCSYLHKTIKKICKACGKEFKSRKGIKYCSESCKKKGYKSIFSVCKLCNKEYIGHGSSKYCSASCYREANKYTNNNIKLVCEVCGDTYIGSKYSKYHICGSKCRNKLATLRANSLMLELFGTTNKEEIRRIIRKDK